MLTVHPRATIGTPEPPANRERLQRVGVLLAHEVGVLNTRRYRSADPATVLDDARAAAAYGISAGKSWEYSYMIGLDGSVFEQAGEYRAAHCLNFNSDSAGVIFLNALDVANTPAQNAAWHELRTNIAARGILAVNHIVAPHYRYRDTSCCGLRAEPPGARWPSPTKQGRLGDLIPALATTPPLDDIGDNMQPINMRMSDTRAYGDGGRLTPNNPLRLALPAALSQAKAAQVSIVAVEPSAGGYLTAWGPGARPETSTVNYQAGANTQGTTLLAVDNGAITVVSSQPCHVVVDLQAVWL